MLTHSGCGFQIALLTSRLSEWPRVPSVCAPTQILPCLRSRKTDTLAHGLNPDPSPIEADTTPPVIVKGSQHSAKRSEETLIRIHISRVQSNLKWSEKKAVDSKAL